MKAITIAAVAVAIMLPGCYRGVASTTKSTTPCETMGDCWKRCEHQDGGSCTAAGDLFEVRGASRENFAAAKDAYEKACTLGHADGCIRSTRFLIDHALMARRYLSACALGDLRGCEGVNTTYKAVTRGTMPTCRRGARAACETMIKGIEVTTRRPKLGERRLSRACIAGNVKACQLRGYMVAEGELRPSSERARLHYLQVGCRYLEPRSCRAIGGLYRDGKGVKRDAQKAYDAFHRACDHGDTTSCRALSALFEQHGTAQQALDIGNTHTTITAYRNACKTGDHIACLRYGQALQIGDGIARNRAGAVRIFEACCSHGDSRGCIAAAKMYHQGWGVAFNPVRAARLYQRGCNVGDAAACRELAGLYHRGRGVHKDTAKADRLLANACNMGSTLACDERQRLRRPKRAKPASAGMGGGTKQAFPPPATAADEAAAVR